MFGVAETSCDGSIYHYHELKDDQNLYRYVLIIENCLILQYYHRYTFSWDSIFLVHSGHFFVVKAIWSAHPGHKQTWPHGTKAIDFFEVWHATHKLDSCLRNSSCKKCTCSLT